MANGTNHDKLAARLDAFEARLEDRSAHRDEEISALREVAADFEARIGSLEKALARQPSVWTLWSPAIGTIAAVGALLWLVLTLRVDPLVVDLDRATVEMNKQRDRYGATQAIDAGQDKEISWVKDTLSLLRERIHRLDEVLSQTRVEEARKEK